MSNCNEDDLNILVQGKVDFVKKSNPGTRNFMSMQQNVVIQKIWWINVCCDDWQAVLCKKMENILDVRMCWVIQFLNKKHRFILFWTRCLTPAVS